MPTCDRPGMASMEEVITQLKRLRPEQVDEVARIVHDLSQTGGGEVPLRPAVPARVVDEARGGASDRRLGGDPIGVRIRQ